MTVKKYCDFPTSTLVPYFFVYESQMHSLEIRGHQVSHILMLLCFKLLKIIISGKTTEISYKQEIKANSWSIC